MRNAITNESRPEVLIGKSCRRRPTLLHRRRDRHQPQRRPRPGQAPHQRRRRGRLRRGQVPEAHGRRGLHPRRARQAAREPFRRDQRRPQARAGIRRGRVRRDRPLLQAKSRCRGSPRCWDEASVDFIDQFDIPCYKIASASLTDDNLLRHTRSTGRPIILSTGMSTIEEIDHAVEVLGKNDLVLLHTTSTYPGQLCRAEPEGHPHHARALRRPVGYSGHETGIPSTVAAVALGACCVERHITLDRAMWGRTRPPRSSPTASAASCATSASSRQSWATASSASTSARARSSRNCGGSAPRRALSMTRFQGYRARRRWRPDRRQLLVGARRRGVEAILLRRHHGRLAGAQSRADRHADLGRRQPAGGPLRGQDGDRRCHQGLQGQSRGVARFRRSSSACASTKSASWVTTSTTSPPWIAGFSAAPATAHPAVLATADLVTHKAGGNGAVRELIDVLSAGSACAVRCSHAIAKTSHSCDWSADLLTCSWPTPV